MLIKDKLYGTFDITEPVLQELIISKPVQRMKGISQFGLPDEFYHFKGFSRYEHCVGVMLLLRRINADIEEQISGLLHDVSHTAFSHLKDWVDGDSEKEDHQDKRHESFILKTEIPKILRKYNLNVNRIINPKNFSLLEQPAPDLCADRVDYSLREFHDWLDPKAVDICLKYLIKHNRNIIFNNLEAAKRFSYNYLKLQIGHWAADETVARYLLFAEVLRYGLKKEMISEEDFDIDDNHIIEKLIKTNDKKIIESLNRLRNKIKTVKDEKNPELTGKKKFRYVDPLVKNSKSIKRLSEIDINYKKYLEKLKIENSKGIKIRVI